MKTWQKPQLIVLLRSMPEETVLSSCKDWFTYGAGSFFDGCEVVNCNVQCQTYTGS